MLNVLGRILHWVIQGKYIQKYIVQKNKYRNFFKLFFYFIFKPNVKGDMISRGCCLCKLVASGWLSGLFVQVRFSVVIVYTKICHISQNPIFLSQTPISTST